MGYMKADAILPLEIIELIQQYADGVSLYIPRKQENRRSWGESTSYRSELQERNQLIYGDYLSGATVCTLAREYCLSEKSIQRIIRQEKTKKVS